MQRIGRYEISGEIGRGASGIVYRATDPAIGRVVALKTIRLDTLSEPIERDQLRERLFREARASGQLLHPNIVTIFDAGEDVVDGQVVAYLAMELVNGAPLDRSWPGPIPNAALCSIFEQVASALDFAHSRGIIHRDVKPANILVDRSGQAKVLDFGIAKLASQQMTHTGTLVGTPSYMSPEQVAGTPALDGRSDQFSLAVVAYEMLTGEKPFRGDTLTTLLYQITQQTPQAAHLVNPSVSLAASVALQRAMSKHAIGRYRSCGAFVAELIAALNQAPGWHALTTGSAGDLPTIAVTAPPVPRATVPLAAGAPGVQSNLPPKIPPAAIPSTGSASMPVGARAPITLPQTPSRSAAKGSRIGLHWTAFVFIVALAIAGIFIYWATSGRASTPTTDSSSPADSGTRPSSLPGAATQPPDTAPATADAGQPVPAAPAVPATQTSSAQTPSVQTKIDYPAIPDSGTSATKDSLPDFSSSEPVLAHLTSQPPGATLAIDNGARTCKSPCAILLVKGDHTVGYALDTYRPQLRHISIPQQPDLDVVLERLTGTLMVRTTPAGASVAVDGQAMPQKTPAVLNLPVGKHKLRLSLEGKSPYEETFEIKDQVIATVNIDW